MNSLKEQLEKDIDPEKNPRLKKPAKVIYKLIFDIGKTLGEFEKEAEAYNAERGGITEKDREELKRLVDKVVLYNAKLWTEETFIQDGEKFVRKEREEKVKEAFEQLRKVINAKRRTLWNKEYSASLNKREYENWREQILKALETFEREKEASGAAAEIGRAHV